LGTDIFINLPIYKTTWVDDENHIHILCDKYSATGTVYATKSVIYQNQVIKDIKIEFAYGRAIEYSAKHNNYLLHQLIKQHSHCAYVHSVSLTAHTISLVGSISIPFFTNDLEITPMEDYDRDNYMSIDYKY
jgi:hypothetical protein